MHSDAQDIREAFFAGALKVKTLDPETGETTLSVVSDVMEHQTGHKTAVRLETESGRVVVSTGDHSVYTVVDGMPTEARADELEEGDLLVVSNGNGWFSETLESVSVVEPLESSYDLCVPGPENFFLSNGILAHNSYSIGGISLDMSKAGQYESLKSNAEQQFEKATEAKARTTKIMRGLKQPRFGLGVRSSFGPHLARGTLSPRNFMVILLSFAPISALLHFISSYTQGIV